MTVLKTVEETGTKAWLVGDTVRMIEMGIQPTTVTLALDSQNLEKVASALSSIDEGADLTVDVRGPFPALRGELDGVPFRAFSLQGNTIEDDLARRDFSIEAIALRSDGGIVDPFGGRLDIRNRVIRLTGDDVELLAKDPLRIVRMLRLAAEFEMDIFWKTDSDVRTFLEANPTSMSNIPPERWGREVINGMKRRPWRFIRLCDAYGLLPFFLKDLEELKRVPDGGGSTLFDHVMKTLRVIEARIDTNKVRQREAFILAGLFSHVGTRNLRERTKQADRLVSDYMTRWNIPSETVTEVLAIINDYRTFYKPQSEEELCAAVLEYSRNAIRVGLEFAACIAEAEDVPEDYREALDDNRWNLDQIRRRFKSVARQTDGSMRFLTGREVMDLLGLAPGRRIGELLDGLDMAVGTGKVSSRANAEAWLRGQKIA